MNCSKYQLLFYSHNSTKIRVKCSLGVMHSCQTAELRSLPNKPHVEYNILPCKFEDITRSILMGLKLSYHNICVHAALNTVSCLLPHVYSET